MAVRGTTLVAGCALLWLVTPPAAAAEPAADRDDAVASLFLCVGESGQLDISLELPFVPREPAASQAALCSLSPVPLWHFETAPDDDEDGPGPRRGPPTGVFVTAETHGRAPSGAPWKLGELCAYLEREHIAGLAIFLESGPGWTVRADGALLRYSGSPGGLRGMFYHASRFQVPLARLRPVETEALGCTLRLVSAGGVLVRCMGALALLLGGVGAVIWQGRRRGTERVRQTGELPEAVHFGQAQLTGYSLMFLWVAWPPLGYFLGVPDLARWLVASDYLPDWGATMRTGATLLGCFLPPIAAGIGLRQFCWPADLPPRRPNVRRELADAAAKWLPLATFYTMLPRAAEFGGVIVGVVLAFLLRIALVQVRRRIVEGSPRAITSGPLRDRVFALAEKAQVKLRQFYLLPTGGQPTVNALAATGNQLMVTEPLLRALDARELDAVLAHELAHLRAGHPGKLRYGYIALGLFSYGLTLLAFPPGASDDFTGNLALVPLGLLLGSPVLFLLTRRFERVADLGAAELTGDPEGVIMMLVRIYCLNHVPLGWGAWREKGSTHPVLRSRVRLVADRFHLPPAEVETLVAREERRPLTAAGTVEAALYGGASGSGKKAEDAAPLFDTSFKQRMRLASLWPLLGLAYVLPGLVARLAAGRGLAGWPLWVLYAAGLVLVLALRVTWWPGRARRALGRLRSRLAARLARQGALVGPSATFVGLSPDERPRLYESLTIWDIGFCDIQNGWFVYAGDHAPPFCLARAEVDAIEWGVRPPGWGRVPRLCVRWEVGAGRSGVFTLDVLAGGKASAARLRERLRAWQQDSISEPEADPRPYAPPAIGVVTSQDVKSGARGRQLLSSCYIIGLLSVAVAAVFGLPWDAAAPGCAEYVLAVAFIVEMVAYVPVWLYREAKPVEVVPTPLPV